MAPTHFSSLLVSSGIPLYWPLRCTRPSYSLSPYSPSAPPPPPPPAAPLTIWVSDSEVLPIPQPTELCHSSALAEALPVTPPFPSPAPPAPPWSASVHHSTHNLKVAFFMKKLRSWFAKTSFPLNKCCCQYGFTKPLGVPACLQTCSQGQPWPALVSLLSPWSHIAWCMIVRAQ